MVRHTNAASHAQRSINSSCYFSRILQQSCVRMLDSDYCNLDRFEGGRMVNIYNRTGTERSSKQPDYPTVNNVPVWTGASKKCKHQGQEGTNLHSL